MTLEDEVGKLREDIRSIKSDLSDIKSNTGCLMPLLFMIYIAVLVGPCVPHAKGEQYQNESNKTQYQTRTEYLNQAK